MSYSVNLWASWVVVENAADEADKGRRAGVGPSLASCACSGFTPRRQALSYGVDFLEALTYSGALGDDMIGDPTAADGDVSGVWEPDWTRGLAALGRLEAAATTAADSYTLKRLPAWRVLVETGRDTPGAVVSMSY